MFINYEMLLCLYDVNFYGDGMNFLVFCMGYENFLDKVCVEKIFLVSVVYVIYWVEDRDLIKSDGVVIFGGWKLLEVSIFENGLNFIEIFSFGVLIK